MPRRVTYHPLVYVGSGAVPEGNVCYIHETVILQVQSNNSYTQDDFEILEHLPLG